MVGKVNEARSKDVLALELLNELVKLDSLVRHILRALLVGLEAKRVATLVHVHGAEAEAENAVLARLPWALPITLSID